MNGPTIINSRIFANEPEWTPEEAANFLAEMERIERIYKKIDAIDVKRQMWRVGLYQKLMEAKLVQGIGRSKRNGG